MSPYEQFDLANKWVLQDSPVEARAALNYTACIHHEDGLVLQVVFQSNTPKKIARMIPTVVQGVKVERWVDSSGPVQDKPGKAIR